MLATHVEMRPTMPTPADEDRSKHQFARLQLAMEDWDEVLRDWCADRMGEERAAIIGLADTSAAPLTDLARQLSTPGLYGKPWTVTHADGGEELAGPDGLMARAGYSSAMAFLQFLVLTIGDMFVDWSANEEKDGLHLRFVHPHNVYREPMAGDDSQTRALWELRWADGYGYVWHVYDREEGHIVYRALTATTGAGPRAHLGPVVEALSTRERLVGQDGRVEVPLVRYADADTRQPWNHFSKRGAFRGTLNAALNWTYAGYCARDASGEWVAIWGLQPGASSVKIDDHGRAIHSKLIVPGTVEYHDVAPDFTGSPGIVKVGASGNLQAVADYADRYEMKQAVRWGLNPTDLSRGSSDPSSAAALMVSNEGKREFSAQVAPVFRAADQQSVRVAAIVARQAGLGTYPERGWVVEYVPIPLSATERQAVRDDLDWQAEHAMVGPIERYRRLHPTASTDDAVAALVRAAAEQRQVDEAMAAAGFASEATNSSAPEPLAGHITTLRELAAQVAMGQLPIKAAQKFAQIALPNVSPTEIEEAFAALAGFTPTPTEG